MQPAAVHILHPPVAAPLTDPKPFSYASAPPPPPLTLPPDGPIGVVVERGACWQR